MCIQANQLKPPFWPRRQENIIFIQFLKFSFFCLPLSVPGNDGYRRPSVGCRFRGWRGLGRRHQQTEHHFLPRDPRPGDNVIKLFSPLSLTTRPNKLECLSLVSFSASPGQARLEPTSAEHIVVPRSMASLQVLPQTRKKFPGTNTLNFLKHRR